MLLNGHHRVIARRRASSWSWSCGLALLVGIGCAHVPQLHRPADASSAGWRARLAVLGEIGVRPCPLRGPGDHAIAVALTGLGLAMIYRRTCPTHPGARPWSASATLFRGIAMFIAAVILIALRDHRMLRPSPHPSGALPVHSCCCPMIPSLGQETFGARVWITWGLSPCSRAAEVRSPSRSSSPATW